MKTQILPVRSATLASLNPNLLYNARTTTKKNDYAARFPFNGDFTGFADIKANLVAQYSSLDKLMSAPDDLDRGDAFENVKVALIDAFKLPSKLREQILQTFFDKMNKALADPSSNLRKESLRPGSSLPHSSQSSTSVAIAHFLNDKLAPTGFRSQVLSHAIGARDDINAHRPRWTLNFGANGPKSQVKPTGAMAQESRAKL